MLTISQTILLILLPFQATLGSPAGSIIPLYIYPLTDSNGVHNWDPLIQIYQRNPIDLWAIVNVNSGPGTKLNSDYASAINKLHSAGINTLGYVSTDYGKRRESTIRSEIQSWKRLYSPNGIFLDEMAYESSRRNISLYTRLTNFAKNDQGFEMVVGNPGTDTTPPLAKTVDTVIIYERAGVPTNQDFTRWEEQRHSEDPNKWSMIPHSVSTLDRDTVLRAKNTFGYIFITNDVLPNPWDTLPPYLEELYSILKE